MSRHALYAFAGPDIIHFDVDLASGTLARKATLKTPYPFLKFGWPDPSRSYLYCASTDKPLGMEGVSHHLSAYRIDQQTGALTPHGQAVPLPSGATHLTLDIPGRHAIAVYRKGLITVNRINADGTVGEAVKQPEGLDVGIFSHQVRVAPSNDTVIVTARGNRPTATKPEEPGSLNVLSYKDGVLGKKAKVAPGLGFGPRNIDFHPTRPWIYVGLELQNRIHCYQFKDGVIDPQPLFVKDSMARPGWTSPHQIAGQLHVHPSGKYVYQVNRGAGTIEFEGKPFWAGGHNDVAVYAINQDTGEPTLIQNEDTRGIYPFSFCISPGGEMLVVGNAETHNVRDSSTTTSTINACLSAYRIGPDGRLTFTAKYDVDVSGTDMLFWTGMYRVA